MPSTSQPPDNPRDKNDSSQPAQDPSNANTSSNLTSEPPSEFPPTVGHGWVVPGAPRTWLSSQSNYHDIVPSGAPFRLDMLDSSQETGPSSQATGSSQEFEDIFVEGLNNPFDDGFEANISYPFQTSTAEEEFDSVPSSMEDLVMDDDTSEGTVEGDARLIPDSSQNSDATSEGTLEAESQVAPVPIETDTPPSTQPTSTQATTGSVTEGPSREIRGTLKSHNQPLYVRVQNLVGRLLTVRRDLERMEDDFWGLAEDEIGRLGDAVRALEELVKRELEEEMETV